MFFRKSPQILFFLSIVFLGCKSDDLIVDDVPQGDGLSVSYAIDSELNLVLYNGKDVNVQEGLIIDNETLIFDTPDTSFSVGKAYPCTYKGSSYIFYRTELPIITISTNDQEIVDEPKIPGKMTFIESGKESVDFDLGIELRGLLSQTFPKKSYSIELREEQGSEEEIDASFLGLREDDDWILDGLWNEPLRIRNHVANALWLKMGRYHYQNEKQVTFGVKTDFCELFLNGNYRGVYGLSEKVDRKQLGLKKFDEGIRGELYKGDDWRPGTLFEGVEPFDNSSTFWYGYEAEYPDEIGELNWNGLYELVDFVSKVEKPTFDQGIVSRMDTNNLVDYYILINVIYATDNIGRNLYVGRYDSETPYFIVPWDLDATFGNKFDGERHNDAFQIISNNLFDRLLENSVFRTELNQRWVSLRSNVLQVSELQKSFLTSFEYLKANGVYSREALSTELPQNYSETEIEFLNSYFDVRMEYLDNYISNL